MQWNIIIELKINWVLKIPLDTINITGCKNAAITYELICLYDEVALKKDLENTSW